MMPKPVMRILLLVWSVLLVVQFGMAAVYVWQRMRAGIPPIAVMTSIPPVVAIASLGLFLVMVVQYRNRP